MKSPTALKTAQKYLLRSSAVVHTTPGIILADLINPESDMRMKGNKISSKLGVPTPKIIYQSPQRNNNNPARLTIIASYRISGGNNTSLLEFFHCYAAIRIGESDDYMIGFATITAEALPPGCDTIELIRKEVVGKFTVTAGWDEMGNYYLKGKEHQQTELTLNLVIDVSPSQLSRVQPYLAKIAEIFTNARMIYDRSEEVDQATINYFADVIIPSAPDLTDEEELDIHECATALGWGSDGHAWKRLPGTANAKIEKFQSTNSDTNIITVKGTAQIDVRAEIVLAWLFHVNSNERIGDHVKANGGTERNWDFDFSSHTCNASIEAVVPLMKNRTGVVRQVWQKGWNGDANAYVLAILPHKVEAVTSSETVGITNTITTASTGIRSAGGETSLKPRLTASGSVIASYWVLFVLESITPEITQITQLNQTDLNLSNSMGDFVANLTAKFALSILNQVQRKYRRNDLVVDSELRSMFINNIESAPEISDEMKSILTKCENLAMEYNYSSVKAKNLLKSSSSRSGGIMEMKYKKNRGWFERSIAIGRCSDVIDCSPQEMVAWIFDHNSRDRNRIHSEGGHIARLVLDGDGRQQLVATVKRMPWPLYHREFVTWVVWSKDDDGGFDVAAASVHVDVDYGISVSSVEGFTRLSAKIGPYGEMGANGRYNQCQMVITQIFDANGYVPSFIVNSKIPQALSLVEEARTFFNRDDTKRTTQSGWFNRFGKVGD